MTSLIDVRLKVILSLILTLSTVFASKAQEVGDITSYNFETSVEGVKIYRPKNIIEVQNIIKHSSATKTKVRFSGASHSTSSLIIGGDVYIKSENFKSIDGVVEDPKYGPVVQIESGVFLGDLAEYLETQGYSLGFAYPYYYGVTMGGLLATGSHGSSRKHVALSSQNIVEMVIVNSAGELVTINDSTPSLLKAAKVNLGLLGFVYKIKLKIYSDFKITFKKTILEDESAILFKDGVANFGPISDTEYIFWFPAKDRAVKVSGSITKKAETPGARSIVLGQYNEGGLEDKLAYKALMAGANNTFLNGILENKRFSSLSTTPPPYIYVEDGEEIQSEGIVGKSSAMLISKRVQLNPLYTTQDISFSFPIKNAAKVMSLIRDFCYENNFYHPFLGVFLRFAKSDRSSFLSHIERPKSKAGETYVMAEFFEPKEYTTEKVETLSTELRRQLIELLVSENLITFHWGKNTDQIFASNANRNLLSTHINEFDKARKILDPTDTFLNDFTKQNLFK